jgi:MFS family permease
MMLVSNWFSKEKQAFIIGLVITIGMLGAVIAQYPFSLLAETFSWRTALFMDAAIGALLLGVIYLFVHDGPKKDTIPSNLSFKESLIKCILNPQNILCGLYTSFMNMPLMVLSAVWASLFLTQVHEISIAKASFIAGMISMGTIIGSPLYGYLAEKTGSKKPWMVFGALSSIFVMSMIMFLPNPSEMLLTSLFFLLGLVSSSQVLGYPIITENSPKELTGTSMGVAAVIIMGLPMLIQPLSGYLLDLNWSRTMMNGSAFYSHSNFILAFLIFPIGFLISFFATKKMNEKMKLEQLNQNVSIA